MGISTHILDTALGKPAVGVPTNLDRLLDKDWVHVNSALTDVDGRCKHLLPADEILQAGVYRVHFETQTYYQQHEVSGLYPYVEIVFTVSEGEQHYHIPLLLTTNGYTTYRGS